MGDDHVLAAYDVGGPQQHGEAKPRGRGERLVQGEDGLTLRALYAHGAEQSVEFLPVLGEIYALGRGAEDLDSLRDEEVRQRDGGLAAEGHDHADGFFHLEHAHDVLGAERLEVEPGGRAVVRRDRLGVVVYDDDVVAHVPERPYAVDGAVVELYALTYPDGPGAEHDDGLVPRLHPGPRVAEALGHGVEIGCAGLELGRAGVDHLVAERRALRCLAARDAAYRRIRVAEASGLLVVLGGEAMCQLGLQLDHAPELAQEPLVYHRDAVQLVHAHALLERLKEGEDAKVVHVSQAQAQRAARVRRAVQGILFYLCAPDRLHQRRLEAGRDGHDLACGLHLRPKAAV